MKTFLVLTLLSLISTTTMFYQLINVSLERESFRRAYEAQREHLESVYRTKGFRINTHYVCKQK